MDKEELEFQIRQLQQVLDTVDNQLVEVENTKKAILEYKESAGETEALVQLANGIFVKAVLSSDKTLHINVGNDVVVAKNASEAITMMDKQSAEIEEYKKQVSLQLQRLIEDYNV